MTRHNAKSTRKNVAEHQDRADYVNRSDKREKFEWIGEKLREFYDATASEPVPEKFYELLRKIDHKTIRNK